MASVYLIATRIGTFAFATMFSGFNRWPSNRLKDKLFRLLDNGNAGRGLKMKEGF
jgi:hypothetical protein